MTEEANSPTVREMRKAVKKNSPGVSKKEKLIFLLSTYKQDIDSKKLARAVDCSRSYARRFEWHCGEPAPSKGLAVWVSDDRTEYVYDTEGSPTALNLKVVPSVEEMAAFLDANHPQATKRNQILALYKKYNMKLRKADVAEAVGCSRGYVYKFSWQPGQPSTTTDQVLWAGNESYIMTSHTQTQRDDSEATPERKSKVLERDNGVCLRCGATDNLEVHHIIPAAHGGTDDLENLATLCKECHRIAHATGSQHGSGRVVYNNREAFWEQWVTGDFPQCDICDKVLKNHHGLKVHKAQVHES